MKYKTTRKAIRERANVIIQVGYGDADNLLRNDPAFAYSTRAEGWACDYHWVASGVVVSTGYAPIGTVRAPWEITKKYDDAARGADDETVAALLKEWIAAVCGK